MENILEIKNLDISYSTHNGFLKSVDNLSITFEKGKVTGVIGESGCGKTTIINSIMKILPANAQIGKNSRIIFKGNDKNLLTIRKGELQDFRWRKASMVFQAAQNSLNPTLQISEQLMDSIWDHDSSISKKDCIRKTEKLLHMVRLNPERVMDSYPHQLSGGMRQRVIIAMALVLEPEFIILDEPTTALDVITQSFIFDILVDLQKQKNLSMILITHDLASAAKLAHNMVIMYGGELMEVAPSMKLFNNPLHPYTKGLLGAIPFIDGDIITKKSIDGTPPDLINKPIGCIFQDRCPKVFDRCKKEHPEIRDVPGSDGKRKVACHLEEIFNG